MTSRSQTVLPALFVVSLWVSGVGAQSRDADWPQWRGPARSGAATSFVAPSTWPDELTRQWSVEVGEGYATPILVGDQLFLFTREGDDEVMRAMLASTGAELWQTRYPAPFSFEAAADPHGPGPKATPTYADGRLFTLGIGGVVTAFSAETGRQLWQIPPSDAVPLYGTAVSPLVEDGLVIVHVGGHDDGALTAFEAATGEVRWAWDGDGPSYASPIVAELAGTRQVVTLSQDHVVGVSLDTGELLWRRRFTTAFAQNAIDPVVVGDLVVVAGFQEPTVAFRVVSSEGRWTTEDVWENTEISLYMTNGVLVDGVLFGLSQRNRGQYFLLDTTTGATSWTSPGRRAENAAIVRAGDTLFVLEDDAELIVGRIQDGEFDEIRRYFVADSPTWAQPTVAGRRLFIKDRTTVALWEF